MTTPSSPSSHTDGASRVTNRRRFIAGAGLTVLGVGSLSAAPAAFGAGDLSTGDAAILRFLAAAEILETDLWQQYNELCGIQDHEVPHGTGNKAFTEALSQLDVDMAQYVHDNTEDEFTHFTFINAYLQSRGAQPVNLDQFRTLPGSTAKGAANLKRITNLMELTVDTSWWTRYRSRTKNPDNGDTFAQAVPALAKGRWPAIPRNNADLKNKKHLQAIANTAGFHFAHDRAGRHQPVPRAGAARPGRGGAAGRAEHRADRGDALPDLVRQGRQRPGAARPDQRAGVPRPQQAPFGGEDFQTNLIMPEPTTSWLGRKFPAVSIVRPTETKGIAMGVAKFLTDDGTVPRPIRRRSSRR